MVRPIHASTDESFFVFRAIDIFRRRKVLVTFVFVAVLASAVTFALYLPELYNVSAVLLVNDGSRGLCPRRERRARKPPACHQQEVMSRVRLTDLINRSIAIPRLAASGPMDGVLDQMRHDIDGRADRS